MTRADASLRAYTGYRLRRTTSIAMSRMQTVFAAYGLRRTTYSTLSIVIANPGLRQGQVAEALAIERPNFVQIVDELEKAGLILREKAKGDKRAYALQATSLGKQVFEKASVAARKCEDMLTTGLTPNQLKDLHDILDVIAMNASADQDQKDA
ncbi:MAG: MarR family winged helix-turn-helix transcriptional regulator [Paracoccaceae bacterium]